MVQVKAILERSMKIRVFQQTDDPVELEDGIREFLTCGSKVKIHFVVSVGNCLTVWYEDNLEYEPSRGTNVLRIKIYNFDWGTKRSHRINNVCNNAGIVTLADLVAKKPAEMLKYRNFGEFCLFDVRKSSRNWGFLSQMITVATMVG